MPEMKYPQWPVGHSIGLPVGMTVSNTIWCRLLRPGRVPVRLEVEVNKKAKIARQEGAAKYRSFLSPSAISKIREMGQVLECHAFVG